MLAFYNRKSKVLIMIVLISTSTIKPCKFTVDNELHCVTRSWTTQRGAVIDCFEEMKVPLSHVLHDILCRYSLSRDEGDWWASVRIMDDNVVELWDTSKWGKIFWVPFSETVESYGH